MRFRTTEDEAVHKTCKNNLFNANWGKEDKKKPLSDQKISTQIRSKSMKRYFSKKQSAK